MSDSAQDAASHTANASHAANTDSTFVLGIETSCDETAASVVRNGREVISNVVATQHELHEEYGGVVPEIASRAHVELILPTVRAALEEAGVQPHKLSAVAVGHRPGLIGSLLVGVAAAKALSLAWDVPLIGVDHVRAHLYAWRLSAPDVAGDSVTPKAYTAPALPEPTPDAPHLGLVVSGGHTSMYRIDSARDLTVIGRTIDDAVGEAFDKAAAILHLPYPGGPNLDMLAESGDAKAHKLPRSLMGRESLDFSYSGLKTSLLYSVRGTPGGGKAKQIAKRNAEAVGSKDASNPADRKTFERSGEDLTESQRADYAASFRAAAIEPVIRKLDRALDAHPNVTALIIGGGVAANRLLRQDAQRLADQHGLPLALPPMAYCTDNAAMIAGLGAARLTNGEVDDLTLAAMATGS